MIYAYVMIYSLASSSPHMVPSIKSSVTQNLYFSNRAGEQKAGYTLIFIFIFSQFFCSELDHLLKVNKKGSRVCQPIHINKQQQIY